MIAPFSILYLLTVSISAALDDRFIQRDSGFERTISYEESAPLSSDFVQLTSTIINDTNSWPNSATSDELNKLRSRVNEYYYTRVFEFFAENEKTALENNYTGDACLSSADSIEYPKTTFHHAKVFGFPPLKNAKQLQSDLIFDPRTQGYNVTANVSSDTVVFTGKFNVSGNEYVFVYQTFGNTYNIIRSNERSKDDDGLFKLKSITESFSFTSSQLTHTVDPFEDNYRDIVKSLQPVLMKVMQYVYLPQISQSTSKYFQPNIRRQLLANANKYRDKALDQLVSSAVEYLQQIDSSTKFNFPPLKFDNEQHSEFPVFFENITIEGLLNFATYKVIPSTEMTDSQTARLKDELVVSYPTNARDRQAYIEFASTIDGRQSRNRFVIQAIHVLVESEMKVDQGEHLVKINPITTADGFTFVFKFDVDNSDQVYSHVPNYLSSQVSRIVSIEVGGGENNSKIYPTVPDDTSSSETEEPTEGEEED